MPLNVGIYTLGGFNSGCGDASPSIVASGTTPITISSPTALALSTIDILFVNAWRGSASDYTANFASISAAVAAKSAAMGGNVRVGLEDSLWAGKGKLATSNAEQVRLVRQIIEGIGLEIADADEAREILAFKGGDKVGF